MRVTYRELSRDINDDPKAYADFVEMVSVRNAVEADAIGSNLLHRAPRDLAQGCLDTEYRPQRVLVAESGGRMVGREAVTWWPTSGARAAVVIGVLPASRGRGIGTALAERLDMVLGELGIVATRSYATHTTTRAGDLEPTDQGSRFLRKRGYELAYCEHILVRHTGVETPASAPPPAGYRKVVWGASVPDIWVEDLAALHTRLSTDIPGEDAEPAVDQWDASRIRVFEAAAHAADREQFSIAIAEADTTRLVGFSRAEASTGSPVALLGPTIVAPDHRGKGLGHALVRLRARALPTFLPAAEIAMMNVAAANIAMRRVSQRAGYEVAGIEGRWVKG